MAGALLMRAFAQATVRALASNERGDHDWGTVFSIDPGFVNDLPRSVSGLGIAIKLTPNHKFIIQGFILTRTSCASTALVKHGLSHLIIRPVHPKRNCYKRRVTGFTAFGVTFLLRARTQTKGDRPSEH